MHLQLDALRIVHLAGASICFGCGSLYALLHAAVTHRMHTLYTNKRIAIVRWIVAIISLIAYITG